MALTDARSDVGAFAAELVGERLWDHQLQLATSPARVRSVCSGRQSGKTRCLALIALWTAFARPDSHTLLISAGDTSSKDVLRECANLATSPVLAGSVLDDQTHSLTLSNGSTIRSVPASEKQIRGRVIDLLVIDEAAFVDESIWTAARWTIIARPGSRVILSSTPWGRRDAWFSRAYRAGLSGAEGYASFNWPSTASPLVDHDLLDLWQASSTDREWRRGHGRVGGRPGRLLHRRRTGRRRR